MTKLFCLSLAICAVFCYGLTAFIAWDYNPAHWSSGERLLFITLTILIGFCLFAVSYSVARKASYDAFMTKQEEERAERARNSGGFQGMLQRQLDAAEEARRNQAAKHN